MKGIREPVTQIRGGAHVPHFKDTAERESARMPSPELVILPMQQHIGAPCKPTVKVGDTVTVGQIVGDTEAFVSAPIHATVSGKVKAIRPLLMSSGQKVEAVHIESDGEDTLSPDITIPKISERADFFRAVRQSGMVGIGGAGFPVHVKLTLKDDAKVDYLIVNGAECEPYITADYRETLENYEHVLAGIQKVMEYVGIGQCLIGIESNKPKSIQLLAEQIVSRTLEDKVNVVELPARYPYGAEKMLIQATTGRQVPLGGLPADVGVIVMNISSVSILNYYLDTGIPLIRKRLTMAGGAIADPQNVFVPIGTPIKDAIDFCGGYREQPEKVLMGGPMMGVAQFDDATPVLKQNNAIICLTRGETYAPRESPCIRCGRCVASCPMGLMPTLIERYAKLGNAEMLKKVGVSGCMECGSCAFNCPARRPLVQHMRYGKLVERKAAMKK